MTDTRKYYHGSRPVVGGRNRIAFNWSIDMSIHVGLGVSTPNQNIAYITQNVRGLGGLRSGSLITRINSKLGC